MLVLAVLLCAVSLLLTATYAQFRWRQRHVLASAVTLPCPPALPLLGNAFFFIGGITLFVVSDPADVQIVLNNSNTLEKDDTYNFLKHFLGNGLLTAPVHTWKKYRRLISPVLHPGNAERFLPVFNNVSRQLVEDLETKRRSVDPRRDIFDAAMDAVTVAVVGRQPVENELKEALLFLFSCVGRLFTYRIFKVWLHIDCIFYFLYRRGMKEALERRDLGFAIFERELAGHHEERLCPESERERERESERATEQTMMDLCLSHPDDSEEDHLWRDETITVVVGATDTIVAALAFLLVTLANHSHAQEKVYEEIQEVLGDSDRDLTLADVNALTYLGQAIMESMRLHGTFPVILRKATRDTKLAKGVLPAGSRILLPLHAMGWDAEQFPQPEKFIPERFSEEYQQEQGQDKRHKYSFLPFSGGPRNCLGKTYAMHIMKVVAVHILRKYKVTTQVRLEDIEYELKVVMFSKTPLVLGLEPRSTTAS